MITDPKIAKDVIETLEGICQKLQESSEQVRLKCPQTEYAAYLRERAQISAQIFMGLLDPLYGAHPDLVPSEAPSELKRRWGITDAPSS